MTVTARNARTALPVDRVVLWTVLVLAVLAMLAPTVSRGLALARGHDGWVEVCTSAGPRWVQAEADPNGQAPLGGVLDACDLCVLGFDRPCAPAAAAPALSVAATVAADLPGSRQPLVLPSPARLAWARAPPVVLS